jgi:hypothetical protein
MLGRSFEETITKRELIQSPASDPPSSGIPATLSKGQGEYLAALPFVR